MDHESWIMDHESWIMDHESLMIFVLISEKFLCLRTTVASPMTVWKSSKMQLWQIGKSMKRLWLPMSKRWKIMRRGKSASTSCIVWPLLCRTWITTCQKKISKLTLARENKRKLVVYNMECDGAINWQGIKSRRLNCFGGCGPGASKSRHLGHCFFSSHCIILSVFKHKKHDS